MDGTSYDQVQTDLKLNHIEYNSDEMSELMSLFIITIRLLSEILTPIIKQANITALWGLLKLQRERERERERERARERERER